MAKNDITGDNIKSRPSNEAYRENPLWDKLEKQKKGKQRNPKETDE